MSNSRLPLPDELLLQIAGNFTHINRATDLRNLALVSRQWRHIAQEELLLQPRLNVRHMDSYLVQIGHRDNLFPRVHVLEIWSTSQGRVLQDDDGKVKNIYRRLEAPREVLEYEDFINACERVIDAIGNTNSHVCKWTQALRLDVVPAMLGVLICALPNIRELKLAEGWLMDFPIFSPFMHPDAQRTYQPAQWKHEFLGGVVDHILHKLEVLEVPYDTTAFSFGLHECAPTFDFRSFTVLKELGISWASIGMSQRRPSQPLREMFPPSLKVLKICDAYCDTTWFIFKICLAKMGGSLPLLERLEVYFWARIKKIKSEGKLHSCLSATRDIPLMCINAGIALYVYFPSYMLTTAGGGGVAWRLQREPGELHKAEVSEFERRHVGQGRKLEYAPFEAEWDLYDVENTIVFD